MGLNESKLSYNTSVRYLLEPRKLEGGYMRATNMNWSPQVYYIHKALVQKINLFYIGLKIKRAIDQSGLLLEKSFKSFLLIQNCHPNGCSQVKKFII